VASSAARAWVICIYRRSWVLCVIGHGVWMGNIVVDKSPNQADVQYEARCWCRVRGSGIGHNTNRWKSMIPHYLNLVVSGMIKELLSHPQAMLAKTVSPYLKTTEARSYCCGHSGGTDPERPPSESPNNGLLRISSGGFPRACICPHGTTISNGARNQS
jgi:hypothetical protein